MTISEERLRSLVTAREFLTSLMHPRQTPGVPKAIRKAAYHCLRHYPGDHYLERLKQRIPEDWGDFWASTSVPSLPKEP